MKKILMFVVLLLGLACAGGGYYIFYFKPQQDAEAAAERERNKKPPKPITGKQKEHRHPEPEVTDYYVSPDKLGVREAPRYDAFVESLVYRGEKLHILEKKNGWGRISRYYVYEEGGEEIAEWVPMEALVEIAPTITKEERVNTVSSYIEKSDDFKQHFEMFVKISDELLKEKTCTPEDFEETNGWIRSLTFKYRDVYFIYCGGIKQANKIYLDVRTGEIFYR